MKRRDIILVVFIALLGITALFLRTEKLGYTHPVFTHNWDHHFYIQMAVGNLFEPGAAPFGWRVLNPLLAKLLPFDLKTNFTLLSFTALWMTAVVTYFMLRTIGFSDELALTGMLFFISLGWATRFNIFDFWLTDPLSFLFVVASIWSIFAHKDLLFMILLVVGVAAKENVIFVAPLYYTINSSAIWDIQALRRSIFLVAPAVLLLLGIRAFIPVVNSEYSAISLLQDIGLQRIRDFSLDSLFSYTIGTFGVSLLILPLFSIKKNIALFFRFLPFIALTYFSLLFALNTERVLVSAFPAIIIMALYGARAIAEKSGLNERVFVPLPFLLIILLLIEENWYVVAVTYEALLILLLLIFSLLSRYTLVVSQSKNAFMTSPELARSPRKPRRDGEKVKDCVATNCQDSPLDDQ